MNAAYGFAQSKYAGASIAAQAAAAGAAAKRTVLASVKRTKRQKRRGRVYGMRGLLSKINSHVTEAVQSIQFSFDIFSQTGWNVSGGSTNSNSLQLAFSLNGVKAYLGPTAVSAGGTGFTNNGFSGIYDQYRICKVELEMLFTGNTEPVGIAGTGPTACLPICQFVVDYDDSNTLTSATNTLGYSSCKTIQFGANGSNYGKQYFYLNRPTVQTATLQTTGAVIGSEFQVSPWLDTDYLTTSHFGIKSWVSDDPNAASDFRVGTVFFNVRMHTQYKNVK